MTGTPFSTNPDYTAIAIAYRNPKNSYIYDRVLPSVPVAAREFEWTQYTIEEGYNIPETFVGRTSRPNQVEFTSNRRGDSVIDYALDSPVPQSDIDSAPKGYDPLARATMQVADYVMLDREKRCADLVFALNTYDASLRATLSGTDQWSDYTNSDPDADISEALDSMLIPADIMVIGQLAFSKLRRHPKLMNAIRGYTASNADASGNNRGKLNTQELAEFFGLEEVIVGQTRSNTAKKGQTGSYSRLWGKHCALLVRNPLADLKSGGVTFGMTAEFGRKKTMTIPDANIGGDGGLYVRVKESVKEVIASNLAGYFFQDCVV